MAKVISGNIEPATLRRKTVSGHCLELVVFKTFSCDKNMYMYLYAYTVYTLNVMWNLLL